MGLLISVFSALVNYFCERKTRENKFVAEDGITLYDGGLSPCARRVRITLLEKKLVFTKIEVDLLKGEHLTPEYANITPNKKVPAITFQNYTGVKDCSLYESNVITEFLDSDAFPAPKLYPSDPWERAQCKMWQDWELGLVDDFAPLVYQNFLPFVLQLMHSSLEHFMKSLPKNISEVQVDMWTKRFNAQVMSKEELENHAVICYQNLMALETALEGKTFLVGDRFTTADLSVLPRLTMHPIVGLPLPASHFPNIAAYLKRLKNHCSLIESQPLRAKVVSWAMVSFPFLVVKFGNWRTGRKLERFDGMKIIDRALGEVNEGEKYPFWLQNVKSLSDGELLVADFPCAPESWQIKLLLAEKGVQFSSSHCPVEGIIGRWAGSGGVFRVQHGSRTIHGMRAVLDYLDSTFDMNGLLPSDPLERAQVLCWQAWDYTMNCVELAPLLESIVIAQLLAKRYGDNVSALLELQSQPQYKRKFPAILQSFICGLPPDSACLSKLSEVYGEIIEAAKIATAQQNNLMVQLHQRLQHLNASLQEKIFLMGEKLTMADIIIFCRLLFFPYVGVKISNVKYPNVVTWISRLQTRTAFKQTKDEVDRALQL